MENETADFFISYTGKDRDWAEWVAWTLEEAGFTTLIQAWDFKAGKNFVQLMDDATKSSIRTVAIISDDYFASGFGRSEWYAAFAGDPEGKDQKLIPVRVSECDIEGLMSQIIYVDLVGTDEETATQRLVSAVTTDQRGKPLVKPSYPGSTTKKPTYPGPADVARVGDNSSLSKSSSMTAPRVARGMRKAISDDLKLEKDAAGTHSGWLVHGIRTLFSVLLVVIGLESAFGRSLPSYQGIPLAIVVGLSLAFIVAKPLAAALVKLKTFRRRLLKQYWIEGFWHIKTFDFGSDESESTGLVEINFTGFPLGLNVRVTKLKSADTPHPTTSTSERALLSQNLKYWNKWSYTEEGDSLSGYASGVFDRKPPTAAYPNEYQGVLVFSDGRPQKMQRAVRIRDSELAEYRKQHGEQWREALLRKLERSKNL